MKYTSYGLMAIPMQTEKEHVKEEEEAKKNRIDTRLYIYIYI
jgi:hypothetical protein